MNVLMFRPLAGYDDIVVATLSGQSMSAAAIVTREPAADPSWPSTWSYRIAGDIAYGPSDPFSSELAAVDHAAERLCVVLGQPSLDWILDRSHTDPTPDGSGLDYVTRMRRAAELDEALAPSAAPVWRPDPTVATLYQPPPRRRLSSIWKAWRR